MTKAARVQFGAIPYAVITSGVLKKLKGNASALAVYLVLAAHVDQEDAVSVDFSFDRIVAEVRLQREFELLQLEPQPQPNPSPSRSRHNGPERANAQSHIVFEDETIR